MKVHLATLGCRLNEAESETWQRGFCRGGHRVVTRPDDADVVVLNTCAVTEEAARKTRKLARRLRQRAPGARLVLAGCYVDIEPQQAAALAGVDLVLDNRHKDRLVEEAAANLEHLCGTQRSSRVVVQGEDAAQGVAGRRTRAFVKVQDGCSNHCTYCVVRIARGAPRSRPVDEVVKEVALLHAAGRKEVVLTGACLGSYGRDLGSDLEQLVGALLARTPIARLRLSSLEPWDLPPGLFDLWRDERPCPHLHLPLQSGSDRILRLMGRRASQRSFRELVLRARQAIPGLSLTSDVIVGFPQETDEDFRATVDFVEEIGFAHLHVFPFSPRPGTAASRLSPRVPRQVSQQRGERLRQVASRMRRAHLESMVGGQRTVLWEGAGAPADAGGAWRWVGLTDNYLRTETLVDAGRPLENRITTTELVGIEGENLRGCVVSFVG